MVIANILKYTSIVIGVGFLSYWIHTNFFVGSSWFMGFLKQTYLFHFIFSLFLIVLFDILSLVKSLHNSLGFVYLASLFLKIGLFVLLFNTQLFGEVDITKIETLALLLPFFLATGLEVYFISRILLKIEASNNN
ncbi:hypothetical protein GCM10011414_05630 [Croceivirga lutea]|uniref:DUF6168 family protein n=1 Tax=Croceivirga lutea TaxID=1775167 RepID=UPI0019C45AE2|nr:hypothetical protein GCM10011414_05630 [Croceivirga lutea]